MLNLKYTGVIRFIISIILSKHNYEYPSSETVRSEKSLTVESVKSIIYIMNPNFGKIRLKYNREEQDQCMDCKILLLSKFDCNLSYV